MVRRPRLWWMRMAAATPAPETIGRRRVRQALLRFAKLLDDRFEGVDDLVLLNLGLCEAQSEIELLGRRPIRKGEVLWPAGLWFRGRLTDFLARGDASAGNPLYESGHFLRCILP